MADIFNMLDTWAASGTVFTGIKLNVVDTASAAGSLLMDLQVGGSSRFKVDKAGSVTVSRLDITGATYSIYQSGSNIVFGRASSALLALDSGYGVDADSLKLAALGAFAWSSVAGATNNADLFLRRDAANTLAQRFGVNAQAFNLYNTYTDASNYERGVMKWATNVLQIGTEKLGTGTARALAFQTDGTARLTISAAGTLFDTTATQINLGGGTRLHAIGNGALGIANSGNAAGQLVFGAFATVTGTRLKPSGTTIQARLGDDSDFTNIQGKLTTETAYTAGAPTATGYLTLYDSTGTAYRVPCVV